jgi:hypothetical protein
MADDTVLFEGRDHLSMITLDRPESLDTMNRELSGVLTDALNCGDAHSASYSTSEQKTRSTPAPWLCRPMERQL